jgi:hypothetical protein
MILIISPNELEEEFRDSWKAGRVIHPNIDFATNAIHATFEGKDVIIYKFSNYGYVVSNQKGTHTISAGDAGIMIQFTNK